MKFLIALCLISGAACNTWQPRSADERKPLQEQCLKERKYSDLNRSYILMRKIPKDHDGDCFFRCMGRKSGIYTDAAGYNATRVAMTFALYDGFYKMQTQLFPICLNQTFDKSESKCTRAGENMRCLFTSGYIRPVEQNAAPRSKQ